ncbi:MAG TPA: pyridoxal phosphate-dependent aminotransferase [Oscillibacter sp.]|jgi:aminotransferase|nr:pyridoxal phosphate-dependent aminotransferase [Oscillibacter sp.]
MRDFEPAKMKRVPFTGIRRVLEKANKLEAEGRKIVHFEVGQPDFDTPANIKEAAKKALDQGVTAYSSNYGDIRLRRAIAEKLERMNHLKVDPTKEIMVTCGGEEAVAAALFALLEKGDEVLIADPSYIPYSSLTKIAEAEPVYVPLDEKNGYCFDLEKLEAAITNKTKLLILCTPGNPTGTMMDEESLRKLAEICCRHDILVLADEAYEQVLYDGNKHISIASLPGMWERTITVQSFSKTYSMCGWRIGYLVAPAELMRIVVRAHQTVAMNACSFGQLGALEALTGPQDSLYAMLAEFDRRRLLLYNGLKELGIPCSRPQAAFYLFPDIGEFGMDSFTFAELLLDKYGVATVPGVEFGKNGENHLRISYATSFEDCQMGLHRIAQCVSDLRKG